VRQDRWKLIVPADAKQKLELYDLDADPYEKKDLAGGEAERVKKLRETLDQWWNGKGK
jgi:arylsulfatase A-like enzyme